MSQDLIAELGFLCLGSRFRRLGERLQAGVIELARREGISVQPAQFPILIALEDRPLTIGALVIRLDISQPGVTRSVSKLIADGLVESAISDGDQRFREVRLAPRGREVLALARERLFPFVAGAVAEMCDEPADSLLGYLDRLDAALDAIPLDQRALRLRDEALA